MMTNAVAEHTATVQKALKDLATDRKAWRKMARECAAGSPQPPKSILERLAPSFEILPGEAVTAFAEDVKAIRTVNDARVWLKTYEKQKLELTEKHADERTLRDQLKELLAQEIEVRKLIHLHTQLEIKVSKMKTRSRTIGVTCERAFGDD